MSTKCFFHTVSAGRGNLGYRNKPIRIGALTESWGPTPGVVGLRDGLVELGYRENHDFVIGVRFTQGDIAALTPACARTPAAGNRYSLHHYTRAGEGRPCGNKPDPYCVLRRGRSHRLGADQ